MPLLLKKGAEADLILEEFNRYFGYGGGKIVIKHRIQKKYRHVEIDNRLRKARTFKEARLLHQAKLAGVPAPFVFLIDAPQRIVIEFIEGERVKDILERLTDDEREKICERIGQMIAKLHKAGIVHGDLTTSNMIRRGDEIYFIDFGLGEFDKSIESRGVDLHLCRRALESAHYSVAKQCYEAILRGYRLELGEQAEEIIKRAEEISKRGRYIPREERVWH